MSEIVIVVFAVITAIFDIKTRRIPNKLILSMFGAWLLVFAFEVFRKPGDLHLILLDSVFGLLIGGGIFMMVYLVSRKGLGGGDVKFMAMAGLFLGVSNTIPAILYGTILAALTGLLLILIKKITRKDKIPLAPFLLAGIVITVLFQ